MNRRELLKLAGISLAAFSSLKKTYASTLHFSQPSPLYLNYNENACGTSALAQKAIASCLKKSHRYPDKEKEKLLRALSNHLHIDEKMICLGNGSSENIQAIIQARYQRAIDHKKKLQLVIPDPTFNSAQLYAEFSNIPVIKIQVKPSTFAFDIPKMQKAAESFEGDTLFYLCNPNNPTSQITASDSLKNWVTQAPENHFFIIDEAYAEFVTEPSFTSAIDWAKQGVSNLAVTRTFSKFYGLAGLRIGYAISAPEHIHDFTKFLSIDNVNMAAMVGAYASLQDINFQQKSRDYFEESKSILVDDFKSLKIPYIFPHANFVFYKTKCSVDEYRKRMRQHHVIVGPGYLATPEWNRITLGQPEEMKWLTHKLAFFKQNGWL